MKAHTFKNPFNTLALCSVLSSIALSGISGCTLEHAIERGDRCPPRTGGDMPEDVTDYLTGNPLPAGTGWVIAEFAVYMLIGAAVTILQIYTAISIGHLAKKHRGWFALLAYVGISIAVSVVMRGCMSLFFQSSGAAADILLGWQISVDNSGWHTQGIGITAAAHAGCSRATL